LDDPKVREIVEKLDYDFSEIENYLGEWRGLGLLARARDFDITFKKFIQDHPEATLVNIGVGLDTTFSRIDNGRIKCYNLYLPKAIKFRKTLIPITERNITIAKSAFDCEWFMTFYLIEEQIKSLFLSLVEHFPKGEIVFDVTSKLANNIINRRAQKAGESEVRLHFGVGNPEKIFSTWSPKIQIKDWYTMWSRTEINPNWHEKTIKAIKRSERFKAAKIIHLKFSNNQ
jgi:O-methyltransferase involved in polyketide biosynthesis